MTFMPSSQSRLAWLLHRLERLGDDTDPALRLDLCKRALSLLPKSLPSDLAASFRKNLADAVGEANAGKPPKFQDVMNALRGACSLFEEGSPPSRQRASAPFSPALETIRRALKQLSRQAEPPRWWEGMLHLATAHGEWVSRERTESIEQSITDYQGLLRAGLADAEEQARMLMNLAVDYCERHEGDRSENLEKAIALSQEALRVIRVESLPLEWSSIMENLGIAYSQRWKGDRAENLERSIDCFEKALQVMPRDPFWADTMMNLAKAYSERPLGNRAENLERSIEACRQALQVRRRYRQAFEIGETQMNLGSALLQRIRGKRANNIEKAIRALCKAQTFLESEEESDAERAHLLTSLGAAYCCRKRGDAGENLEKALSFHRQAMGLLPPDAETARASIWMSLAAVYARRLQGDRKSNLAQAFDAYRQGLALCPADSKPHQHRSLQRGLGDLLFAQQRWEEACRCYASALRISRSLRQAGLTPASQSAELQENRRLPSRLAYSLARLGGYSKAVETLEQNNALTMASALARSRALQDEAVNQSDREALRQAFEEIRRLEASSRRVEGPTSDFLQCSGMLRQARTSLSRLLKRIRKEHPRIMKFGLKAQGIQAVAAALGCPLVYFLTTLHGSLALIVLPQPEKISQRQVLWLDDFRTTDLEAFFFQDGYLASNWGAKAERLRQFISDFWPVWKEKLVSPLVEALQDLGCRQAVLIPDGALALLPLSGVAAELGAFWSSAPLAQALLGPPSGRPRGHQGRMKFLGVADPRPETGPLPFGRLEVEQISSLFPPQQVRLATGVQACRSTIFASLPEAAFLHLACHGEFRFDSPLDSCLFLADRDRWTLKALLDGSQSLSGLRMVVLSACQTGLSDFIQLPDEATGFPSAFLMAGVPVVLSALWPVADLSTALLLVRFYRHHLSEGLTPSKALQKAQYWLRTSTAQELRIADLYRAAYRKAWRQDGRRRAFRKMRYWLKHPARKPFSEPYYWAGFAVSGHSSPQPDSTAFTAGRG